VCHFPGELRDGITANEDRLRQQMSRVWEW
jgi:hypothetical protein